jgi:hypothetical protein
MQLPFCKICGMNHRLGFCPLYQEPPAFKPSTPRLEKPAGDAPKKPVVSGTNSESKNEAANHQAPQVPEKESAAVAAQDQGRQMAQHEAGRPLVPPLKPKFDKRAYQRDLMRKRRALGLAK